MTKTTESYFKNKRVWITGASSGIGKALALELGKRGARVAITARDTIELNNVAAIVGKDKCLVIPFDVTIREQNHRAVAKIRELWGGLDIVFFNAGTAEYIDIKRFDAAVFERTISTNFLSMVYGIESVLPLLRNSTTAQLGGMSSTVSFAGIPRAEAYGASKAAIRNMLQGLRVHLLRENIDVFTVCPGFVRTPLTDKNDFPMPLRIEADEAAIIIADGIARHKPEIHFPKTFSIPYKILSWLPGGLYTRLMLKTVRQA
ncbi:MAG: SDR family NAD(P)-dependent oxidoreductase [Gammaproteobacteria bacterium]|jgi:NAD(P)-dependent dehydrogenase (short-subunit alcohol dehydrogenase family)